MRERALKRRSFVVDERDLRGAKRVLQAESDSETVRLALERVVERARAAKADVASQGEVSKTDRDESRTRSEQLDALEARIQRLEARLR